MNALTLLTTSQNMSRKGQLIQCFATVYHQGAEHFVRKPTPCLHLQILVFTVAATSFYHSCRRFKQTVARVAATLNTNRNKHLPRFFSKMLP